LTSGRSLTPPIHHKNTPPLELQDVKELARALHRAELRSASPGGGSDAGIEHLGGLSWVKERWQDHVGFLLHPELQNVPIGSISYH